MCVCYGVCTVFTERTHCEGRRKNETGFPVDGSPQYELHSTRNAMTTWSFSRKAAEYMLLGASCSNIFIYNCKLTSFMLSVSRNVLAELTWCRELLLVLYSRLPWSRFFLPSLCCNMALTASFTSSLRLSEKNIIIEFTEGDLV